MGKSALAEASIADFLDLTMPRLRGLVIAFQPLQLPQNSRDIRSAQEAEQREKAHFLVVGMPAQAELHRNRIGPAPA